MTWHIDQQLAGRVVKFFERGLHHVKGEKAGEPFTLAGWQRDTAVKLFGTVDKGGRRRYRRAFIGVPRKNGKSTFAAGMALYLLVGDQEPGAEVYSAAADRNQASIVFRIAKDMLKQSPLLTKLVRPYQHHLEVKGTTTAVYRPLSAEAYTAWGLNPSGIIFDELHALKAPDFWTALTTGGAARRQPMTIVITTAGWDRTSVCWQEWHHAAQVQEGTVTDDELLPVIYAADTDEDWTDEKVWAKANPNLGESVSIDYLRQQCREAQSSPRRENAFRQLFLNQWTEQAERWLSMEAWDACGSVPVDEAALIGRECWAGLDLASTTDVAALVLVFPDEDGGYDLLPYFWVPGDTVERRTRTDGVPYREWVDEGLIDATPGNQIDYRHIREQIKELGERFQIVEIGFDPWNASMIAQQLAEEDGFSMVQVRQGTLTMNEPSKELERLVMTGKLNHGGNPVLRWMASNVAVKTDASDNIRPDKQRSTEKIDGIVAAIVGLARAMLRTETRSVYDERGILYV